MFGAVRSHVDVMVPCVVICPCLLIRAIGVTESPAVKYSSAYAGTHIVTTVDVAVNHACIAKNKTDLPESEDQTKPAGSLHVLVISLLTVRLAKLRFVVVVIDGCFPSRAISDSVFVYVEDLSAFSAS